MRIEGRMTRNPITIDPRDLISKAEAQMKARGFHLLPVVENGKLVGVLTKSDLTSQLSADSAQVFAAMTRDPLTIGPEASAEYAASMMVDQKIRSIPVVENGNLIGIVTTTDLLRAFLDAAADLARIARD